MSISIVSVVLNAAADLSLTIESVRQQDYRDVELIVVDGGSLDDTAAVLALYADVIDKVVCTEDAGIYHAMNIALDHCSNDYVLFLNAKDTLFDSTALSRMMACKRDDVDVFFGNHVYVQGRREYFKRSIDYDLSAALLMQGEIDHVWLARLPGHQATFVRADLLRRLRFNTDIEICADHDVMMRAHRAGARFQYIDQTVSHYVGGGFSAQRPERLMLEWCALYREYSAEPAAVDRFFLGDTPSPFGPQNGLTGIFLAGDYPREMLHTGADVVKAIAWCRPDGTKLRVPERGSCWALRLEGFCPFDDQRLTLFCGDDEIATVSLDKGWFSKTVDFTRDVAPLAVVDIATHLCGEISHVDRRIVGFAMAAFAFEGAGNEPTPLTRGDKVAFSTRNRATTERMLGSGWGVQESDFIWTVGESAVLRTRLSPSVTSLVLRCMGNPFVQDPERRGVDIEIDGRPMGRHLLGSESPQDIVLQYESTSPTGISKIELRPLTRLGGGQERRTLGVCVTGLECR